MLFNKTNYNIIINVIEYILLGEVMKIISHRGNGISQYNANTKQALLTALNIDFIDGIEFDVRITKDKKIVIIHDPIINFVSNGSGIVKNMKYKKLLKYNFGNEKYPSKICTLKELLDDINSDKKILIELKEESNDFKMFVNIVYNIIKNYDLNIYIASFNYELIKYFKTKFNNCGLIIGNGINVKRKYNNFNFNILSYKYRKIYNKKETFLWTINDKKEDLEKYNIITDKPYLFKN